MPNLHNVADVGVGGRFDIDFDVVNTVQKGQIPGGKLELIDRDPIPLLGVLLDKVHRQGVDNHAVVNLDNQLIFVKEPRRLFHQEHGGEGHEIPCALQCLRGVLGQEGIDGISRSKLRRGIAVVSAEGLIFAVI